MRPIARYVKQLLHLFLVLWVALFKSLNPRLSNRLYWRTGIAMSTGKHRVCARFNSFQTYGEANVVHFVDMKTKAKLLGVGEIFSVHWPFTSWRNSV